MGVNVPNTGIDTESTKEKIPCESRLRSILKGLSWRLLATMVTGFIAFFWSKDVWLAVKISLIEFPAKFLIYYVHERVWTKIPLGTIRNLNPLGNK